MEDYEIIEWPDIQAFMELDGFEENVTLIEPNESMGIGSSTYLVKKEWLDSLEVEVRITFRSEVYLSGKTMQEIKDKWEALPLYSEEASEKASADFIEVVSVEGATSHKDMMSEWNKI